jgi:hypothetical protein
MPRRLVGLLAASLSAVMACGARSSLDDARAVLGATSAPIPDAGAGGSSSCLPAGAACDTDAACCGHRCGDRVCRDAPPCRPGDPPVALATDVSPSVLSIALEPGGVFYPSSAGSIARVSTYGGAPEPRVAADVQVLALEGRSLFFAQRPVDCAAIGCSQIARADAGGGAAEVLATDVRAPTGIAADATSVVWAEIAEGNGAGRIRRLPRGGGPAEVLASGLLLQSGLALDGGIVYFDDGSALRSVPAAGGPLTTLAPVQTVLGRVAVAGGSLFFGTPDSSVVRTPKEGGALVTLASGVPPALDVAVDAQHVYWTTLNATPSVNEVPAAGGAVKTLAQGTFTLAVAVDEDCVYYVDGAGPPENTPMTLYKVGK